VFLVQPVRSVIHTTAEQASTLVQVRKATSSYSTQTPGAPWEGMSRVCTHTLCLQREGGKKAQGSYRIAGTS
jgi:hypothetical protein